MSLHADAPDHSQPPIVFEKNQVSVAALAAGITEAQGRIAKHVIHTPTIHLPWLGSSDVEVWAKLESTQHSGSFKYRGAVNALIKTNSKKIITASAGNHALATLAAGKALSRQVHVIAPTSATDIKVRRLSRGADVTLLGRDLAEATREAIARAEASVEDDQDALFYLSPYADPDVAAGAGTMVAESFEDMGSFDHVIVPLGGGGLAAAVGAWCSQNSPSTKVHCTHPSVFGRQFNSSKTRFISQELHKPTTSSFSDGLAVQLVQDTPLGSILDTTINSVLSVSESDTAIAIAQALRLQSLLIEGSAATAIAGLTSSNQQRRIWGRVLLLLTGGNVSANVVAKALVKDLHDPEMRQELGLRSIVNSVDRYGSVKMKISTGMNGAKASHISTMDIPSFWSKLFIQLQGDVERLNDRFEEKQDLICKLGLQVDSWSDFIFRDMQKKIHDLSSSCIQHLKRNDHSVATNWIFEERYRLLLQLYGTLFSLLDRTSASNDQSRRNWFFEIDAQNASNCNYDRYGSSELRRAEQRFLGVLKLGDGQPVDLLLTSSGMAAYQVIQNYILQQTGSCSNIVMSPYVYFETMEQIEELPHLRLIHAPSFAEEDIVATAETNDAKAIFLDPVANTVDLSTTDIRKFARLVSSRPGWERRIVVIDGTMESGAMPIYDWFVGPHKPTVLYYESVSKYLQLGLDLQMGGLLVYPSELDQTMRIIRRNTGSIMYSRNVALLPPLDFSLHYTRMSHLTANAEHLTTILRSQLQNTVQVNYPDVWRAYGWRHGGAIITLRFLQSGLNNKEGLEAYIELVLRAAEEIDFPITKGVSFGFSTTRVSAASSMAKGMDPFLRFSIGSDIMDIDQLAGIIIKSVTVYMDVFDEGDGNI